VIEFSDKLNSRVDAQRIEAIPLSGRDFNSLLNVMPGVQHRPGGGFQGLNVSGARTTSNNFMIDGISNNDRYYGDSVLSQTASSASPRRSSRPTRSATLPSSRRRRRNSASRAAPRSTSS